MSEPTGFENLENESGTDFSFKSVDPRKIVRKVEDEVRKIADKAKSDVGNHLRWIERDIENGLKKTTENIESNLKKGAEEALRNATKIARKAFSEIEGAILSGAVKEAAKKALALAKLGPQSIDFSVQAVVGIGMTFSVDEVLSYFQEVIDNPPSTEKGLIEFIKASAPTEVRVFASGGLSLGVDLSVEAGVVFQKETLIENWKAVIEEFS